MIRAVLATAIALVVAWSASVPVLPRLDEGRDRHPVAFPDAPRSQPPDPQGRGLPTVDGGSHPQPDQPSDLLLEAALAPLPRPLKVYTLRPLPRPPTPGQIRRGARIPLPPASLRNASDLTCIAVAIYHEARDQEDLGQRAVASVILQRAAVPHRWGDTACDNVVPTQFSFLTSRYGFQPIDDMEAWAKAVRFAADALLDGPMPELNGADHYHTTSVAPGWAPRMLRVQSIDDHVFYVDPSSSSL